jgi:hypothetical protein
MTHFGTPLLAAALGLALVLGAPPPAASAEIDKLQVVDCKLPGQIRKLGSKVTYLSPPRPAKLPASQCEISGGEYVAYDRADYRTALSVWLPQAEKGEAAAQTYVGEIYEKGLGVPPDHAQAAAWYRKAAEQGYPRAQINLGHLYELGLGVARDPAEAVRWYRQAVGLKEAIALDAGTVAPGQGARLHTLEQSLEKQRQEADALRQQLEDTRRQLEKARQALESKSGEIDVERDKARQTELIRQKQDLARLEGQTEQLRQKLAKAETRLRKQKPAEPPPSQAPQAGPSIELIEPPLLATRGPAAVPAAPDSARDIIGRVSAPAGLLTLTLNDRSEKPDANGLFHARLAVGRETVPVKLVAVDRQGKRATLEFALSPRTAPAPPPEPPAKLPPVNFGRYHALVIGIDDYQDRRLPKLKTAVRDAETVAETLDKRYGFNVRLLRNPTRYQVISALNEYHKKLTDDDNFLLYYAGHGTLLEGGPLVRGQWMPADAEKDSPANWISNVEITDHLSIMPAKQALVIADSCYSGALTRSALARLETGMSDKARLHWLQLMASKRSRTVLTSGGLAPVLDAGGGRHSVFAKALLEVLEANGEVLEAQRLYREVSARVALAAERFRFEQVPEYAPIQHAGHEAGDFFFVPKRN